MGELLRLRFSKTGKAKYMSHLDLMSTMRRALLRAGVGLKYTEGFNPHPYMSVALPLSIGCGSICELIDFSASAKLSTVGLPETINATLPEGLVILEAYNSERKFSAIAWIELLGVLYYDSQAPSEAAKAMTELFKSDSLVISKKTKRGVSDIDLASYIRDAEVFGDNELTVRAKVSAGNPTISPDNLLSVLNGDYGFLTPDFSLFTRMEIYDSNMNIFR